MGTQLQVRMFFRDSLGDVENLLSEPMAVIADQELHRARQTGWKRYQDAPDAFAASAGVSRRSKSVRDSAIRPAATVVISHTFMRAV